MIALRAIAVIGVRSWRASTWMPFNRKGTPSRWNLPTASHNKVSEASKSPSFSWTDSLANLKCRAKSSLKPSPMSYVHASAYLHLHVPPLPFEKRAEVKSSVEEVPSVVQS